MRMFFSPAAAATCLARAASDSLSFSPPVASHFSWANSTSSPLNAPLAPGDLLPEEGGDLIPDNPVQNTARLLGVHPVHIDRVRIGKRTLDLVLGDRGEDHPLRVGWVDPQFLREVPGDRLALPVKVGRE